MFFRRKLRQRVAELEATVAELRSGRESLLVCTFCGKLRKNVKHMISGHGAFICNECVEMCVEILAEEAGDSRRPLTLRGHEKGEPG